MIHLLNAEDLKPAETRAVAESRVEWVFAFLHSDREQALLFHLMQCAGWSGDRARSVLRRERWWLA